MPVNRHPIAVSKSGDALAVVPLDVGLIGRLRASYQVVRARDVRLAEVFYAKLFAAAPQLRAMFQSDPAEQARKLMASLDVVVQNLERPGENAAVLAALGRRHVAYGARPEHYDLVVDMLVESIREVGGSELDAPSLDEWRMALRLISWQMIAASTNTSA